MVFGSKIALGAAIAACTLISGAGLSRAQEPVAATLSLSGTASWYGPGFQGRRTASGERFNTQDLTAAHRTLPFGTRVKVTNTKTG